MAEATLRQIEGPDRSVRTADGPALAPRVLAFYAGVVIVQGVHVIEHIIQDDPGLRARSFCSWA
jgi:hypothetical protein